MSTGNVNNTELNVLEVLTKTHAYLRPPDDHMTST